jgi:hypothetical protein
MPSQFLAKLSSIRLHRHTTSGSNGDPEIPEGTQKLAVLIQALPFAEKAAGATSIPYLKGAISMALAIAECARVSDRCTVIP